MKPEQILIIKPHNELRFVGPFNKAVTTYMTLKNPTQENVFFKIKTTAPKKYCVRPNSGFIEPRSSVEIAIILHPVYFDAKEENKHKFMVQSVIAPEGNLNAEAVWNNISPGQLMDSKLKCVFVMPEDEQSDATEAQKNEEKSKVLGDVKTTLAAKGGNFESNDNMENLKLLQKARYELKLMKDSESKLRLELLKLNEQLLQANDSQKRHSYSPPQKTVPSVIPLAVAVGLAILGIFIGKFLI